MKKIVLRMSKKAAVDLHLQEGQPFSHAGRSGRVVGLESSTRGVLVTVEVEEPTALTGIPGEPPAAESE